MTTSKLGNLEGPGTSSVFSNLVAKSSKLGS